MKNKAKPKYKSSRYQLYLGKSEEVLKSLPSNSIHSIVCDPPYELGYMGKGWDSSGIAYNVDLWKECLRVLKPGGHLLAFSGSRTYHRMTCAIEDAGFEVRDQIMWLYGCLDDKTECLTKRGWLKHTEMTQDDSVMQWDSETGKLTWTKPKQIMRYPFTGELDILSNRHTHQVLTPNHRVYAKIRRHSRHPTPTTYEVVEARHIANRSSSWHVDLPMAGILEGNIDIPIDTAYLVGWWLTDAWKHGDGKACMFSQSKPEMLVKLRTALAPHSPSEYVKKPKKKEHSAEHTFYVTGSLAKYLLAEHPKRSLRWSMLNWTLGARLALIEGLLDGDGTRKPGQYTAVFWSQRKKRRAIFSALALSVGWRTYEDAENGCVNVNMSTNSTQIQAKHKSGKLFYDGIVWCVSVPKGAFVVRRNGLPFITGNSGFPKSRNISKDLSKSLGAERKKIRVSFSEVRNPKASGGGKDGTKGATRPWIEEARKLGYHETDDNNPVTDLAKQYQGFGTALKPAHEPICVARKPFKGNVAQNVVAHSTGALNIDVCRVGNDTITTAAKSSKDSFGSNYGGKGFRGCEESTHVGRWPANIIHDGSDEVVGAFPSAKGAQGKVSGKESSKSTTNSYGNYNSRAPSEPRVDQSTNASRFFYCAKASRKDRDEGLSESYVDLTFSASIRSGQKWVNVDPPVRLRVDMGQSPPKVTAVYGTPSSNVTEWNTTLFGNVTTDQYQKVTKSITKTKTSSTIKSEILKYLRHWSTSANIQVASGREDSNTNLVVNVESHSLSTTITNAKMASLLGVKNVPLPLQLRVSVEESHSEHPTVKPVDLMRYLVRLVTPTNGIVLDPFMGSGSTGKACMLEGFKFAGIDMTPEYLEIARARIKHAKDTGQQVVKEVPQTKPNQVENKALTRTKSLFKK